MNCRQWVVEAHQAGPLTLNGILLGSGSALPHSKLDFR